MSPIPTISLADANIGHKILQACVETGFFYLCDHGIPASEVDAMFERSRSLFLDHDESTRLEHQNRADNTGYTPLHNEKLDASSASQGDLKQSFYLAALHDAVDPEHRAPSQTLPPVLEEDRQQIADFIESCRSVCARVLVGFAEAMELEPGYFVESHHGQHDRLRLIHYPPTTVPASLAVSQSIRAGSHSDYGSCTLLFQKDVGGLQVQTKEADWVDIPPQAGCLVVNVGDAMEFWSAGLLQSTQHRVVLPRSDSESGSRFSMAYFCQPDEHARLVPLHIPQSVKDSLQDRIMTRTQFEQRCAAKGVINMSELTGGQHLRARLKATYSTT